MTSSHIQAKFEIKTVDSRNNMLRNWSSIKTTKSDTNFIAAFKLWTKSLTNYWIIEINFSKLSSIYST